MMNLNRIRPLRGLTFLMTLSIGLSASCSSDSDDDGTLSDLGSSDAATSEETSVGALTLAWAGTPPTSLAAGESAALTVVAMRDGAAVDVSIAATVVRGFGSVETTGLGVTWSLGKIPVSQSIRVQAADSPEIELVLTVETTLATPYGSEVFGDVHGFLNTEGKTGSTEDLVFTGDRIVMGAPEGLVSVGLDGQVTRIALSGDPIERGWGVAATDSGALWVVDSGAQVLMTVSADGVVTTVLADEDGTPFDGLNDVEVGPNGDVFATDPCTARLIRYSPTQKAATGVATFDLETQGGPNGMAFDNTGQLYVSTENTVVLCGHGLQATYTDPLAGIYRITVTPEGLSAPETIATEVGVFGDGLTFDDEGNLYGIFDTLDVLSLGESAVWVLDGGTGTPKKVVVAKDVLYANLGFGKGEFGTRTLYLALLAIAPLTPEDSRGLHRVELGVEGATWRR